MAFKLGMTVDLCMVYLLILVSITLTVGRQRQNLSARLTLQLSKQATISIQLAITVSHFYVTLALETFICLDHLFCITDAFTHHDLSM